LSYGGGAFLIKKRRFLTSASDHIICLRPGDDRTAHLKKVVNNPSIEVGDYMMYNHFFNIFFDAWGLDVTHIADAINIPLPHILAQITEVLIIL